MFKLMHALLPCFLAVTAQFTLGQSPSFRSAAEEAGTILTILAQFERSVKLADLNNFQGLVSNEVVYSSEHKKVVSPADLNQLWKNRSSAEHQLWDERTTPILRADSIQEITSEVRLVHGCEYQPTLMVPGTFKEFTMVQQHQQWRVASFVDAGPCDVHLRSINNKNK